VCAKTGEGGFLGLENNSPLKEWKRNRFAKCRFWEGNRPLSSLRKERVRRLEYSKTGNWNPGDKSHHLNIFLGSGGDVEKLTMGKVAHQEVDYGVVLKL